MRTCQWILFNGSEFSDSPDYCGKPCEGKNVLCATHSRLARKEVEQAEKATQKRNTLIAQQKAKNQVPRKRVNPVSEKQSSLNEQYKIIADDYKKRNPECKAKVSPNCTKDTADIHHTRGHGKYFLDETTFLPVCRSCHIWIGDNHKEAEAKGLVFSRLATIKPTI